MKELIISIVAFLLIVALAVVNAITLENIFSEIDKTLTELPTDINYIEEMSKEKQAETIEKLSGINEHLKKHYHYIEVSIPHNYSEDFTEATGEMRRRFADGDYPSYLACLDKAKTLLGFIIEMEKPTFENIF